MANIFISHSSKDNQATKEIFNSLKTISNSIFLDFDTAGHGLKGGQKWEKQLYLRIKKSRIMIVALSPNWLDSKWCYKEYCMARVLRKRIIPVVIEYDKRIDSWDGIDIQYFDTTNDLNAIEKLQEQISELTQSDISKIYDIKNIDAPFVGLRSFNQNEAGIFYGRSQETLDAIDRLNGMADSQGEKFLNIIGASGVGKSSFLKAGILPLLQHFHQESWYLLPIFRAKQEILLNLAKTFAIASDSTAEVLKKLENSEFKPLFDELELYIYDEVKKQNLKPKDLKILLPIDQTEEILSSTNQAQKEQFFKILHYLLEEKSNFFIVWTLRSDHLKKYQDEAMLEFLHQQDETLLLKPIATKELKSIIQEPAYVADILIDESVVDEIKEDIHSTTSLPLLAYFLQELYKNIDKTKRENRQIEIGLNDYKALSSDGKNPIEDIINQQAEKIYKRVTDKKAIENLFLNHLIKVNSDETITKQSTKLKNIPQEQQSIVEQFVERRLFVKDSDDGEEVTVEIAHEALISSWDRLIRWIDGEREFLIFRGYLNLFYREWIKSDRNVKALLGGLNLEKALSFRGKFYDQDVVEFIDESIKYREEEEKKYKELYQKANHNIALLFVEKAQLFVQNKDYLKANYFASLAIRNIIDKHDSSNYKSIAKGILLNRSYIKTVFNLNFDFEISNVKITPNGKIAIFSSRKKIYIYDVRKNEIKATIVHKNDYFGANFLAISNDSNMFAIGCNDSKIKLYTIDGEIFKTIKISNKYTKTYKNNISTVLFNENNEHIICGSWNDTIKIFDIKTTNLLQTFDKNYFKISSLAVSYNTSKIVSATFSGLLRVWDLKNEKLLHIIDAHQSKINSLLISSNGKNIITASSDKTIKIWDIENGVLKKTLIGHIGAIYSLALMDNDKILISCSYDKHIKFWNLDNGEIFYNIVDHSDVITASSLSKDKKTLLSVSYDGSVKVRDISNIKEFFPILKNDPLLEVTSVSLSSDNTKIAKGLANGKIIIYDINSHKTIFSYTHKERVTNLYFMQNNQKVISCSFDGTIQIADLNSKNINIKKGHHGFYAIDLIKQESQIISLNNDFIEIWDFKRENFINNFGLNHIAVSFSLNKFCQKIAIGSYIGSIDIWDFKLNSFLYRLEGHTKTVTSIVSIPNDNYIISGSEDKTIKIWDIEKAILVNTLSDINITSVVCLAISKDGNILISGSSNGIIHIWQWDKGQLIATIFAHRYAVSSLSISENNKLLISSSYDGTVKNWNISDLEFSKNNMIFLEQQLQSKLDGITLVPTKIPYDKPIWSKYHPNHWLKDAKNGDAKAMYKLGLIHDRDNENQKALEWYKKSAQKGYKEAEERVVFLEEWMKEKE